MAVISRGIFGNAQRHVWLSQFVKGKSSTVSIHDVGSLLTGTRAGTKLQISKVTLFRNLDPTRLS